MDTQHKRILEYLGSGRSLTTLEAVPLIESVKLTTRISELRRMGYIINDEWVKTPSGKRIKRYTLG